jgi:cytochrome P450
MADIAALRTDGPFVRVEMSSVLGGVEHFVAVIGHEELTEISKNPEMFCSGQGAISIEDMPADMTEYFGSFITMDNPRHARLRRIVGRSFTPRRLEQVVSSVEVICSELIDEIAEVGEVDLVETISAPFPLLVICDMMGIPRSEFETVLRATNVILGAGDPEMTGGQDPLGALLEAGMTLTELVNDLAVFRRSNPTGDLTSALVSDDEAGERLAPEEIAPFFILLAVAGNDTTRTATSLGMHFLGQYPEQREIWQNDLEVTTPTAVEEIVRFASPVTFMRRTVTESTSVSGYPLEEGEKLVLLYGAANRDPRVFPRAESFEVQRDPNPHIGFGGPGPHFCLGAHLARRELSVVFRQLLTRLPDIHPSGPPDHLVPAGIPLVGGVKHLPVRFSPVRPLQNAQ